MDKRPQISPAPLAPETQPGVRRLVPSGAPASDVPPTGETTAALTQAAFELGIVRLGFASPDSTEEANARATRWRERGYHGTMTFMAAPRQTPEQLLPGVRSVIVAAVSTETPLPPPADGEGYVAAYARGSDYHSVLKHKLWQLAQVLCDQKQAPLRARVCVDTAPILEREWARRAGITFTGKSTMAIAPGVGTTVLLGLLLTDVDLAASTPLPDGCGSCTRCLDACPTQAFPLPFVLDARRCIAYLTIEQTSEIPVELRASVGSHVFGCDICQQVCPYNASRKRLSALAELEAVPARRSADLVSWLRMTSGDYRRLTRDSALRRTSRARLQRNAAVALGNALTEPAAMLEDGFVTGAVEALRDVLLTHPIALVRQHAAWSLGKAATHALAPQPGPPPAAQTNPALQALRLALEQETDPMVAREIRDALEQESSVLVDTRNAEGTM